LAFDDIELMQLLTDKTVAANLKFMKTTLCRWTIAGRDFGNSAQNRMGPSDTIRVTLPGGSPASRLAARRPEEVGKSDSRGVGIQWPGRVT
jgi:hypothetical protein